MNRCSSLTPWLLATLACLVGGNAVHADALDVALLRATPKVLDYLKKHDCRTVGVLKFLVKKQDGELTDNAGVLNLTVAQRLEMALILSDDNPAAQPDAQIAVLRDASAVAAGVPGANHTTAAGRKPLFDADYPLAWGNKTARPDVLLVGVVHLSKDRSQFHVNVYALHRDALEAKPTKVVSIPVGADPATLAEIGESFHLRGIADDGKLKLEPDEREKVIQKEAAQAALRAKEEKAHPAAPTAEAPLALTIFYNDKPQAITFVNGEARVREPEEGEKVRFVLERRDPSKTTYGVVLKVNGENTLEHERKRDVECIKWVLEPGDKATNVRGFQKGTKVAEEFRILSRAESKAKEFYYGKDVGLVTLTVFRNRFGGEPPPSGKGDYEEEDARALQRGLFPTESPKELARLKELLRKQKSETRGLVVGGDKVASKVQVVKFTADPTPVMAVTIRYYKP